jgi:hypothetical protein
MRRSNWMVSMEGFTSELGGVAAPAPPSKGHLVLCSLRIVSVRSEHYLGRRYVMELASDSRGRELRIYRSFEHLMRAIAELGLPSERYAELDRQLFENGCCNLLNIVL